MNSCKYIKAKDPPWDAVLMGSVASTVSANIVQKLIASMFFIKKFNTHPAIIVGRLQHLEKMHFSEGREFLEPVNLEVSSSNVAS